MQAATAPRNSSVSLWLPGVWATPACRRAQNKPNTLTQDDECAAGALSVAAPSLTRAPQGQGAHRTSIPLPTLSRLARRARS
eukprot:scaffold20616_cov63-Phaeocystis_antarctica.AAC.3